MSDNPLSALADSPTEAVAIACLLRALGAERRYKTVIVAGLPDASVYVAASSVMIVTTTAPAPLYRPAVHDAALAWGADVILLRVPSRIDDGLLVVTADIVAAALPCAPWIATDLEIWIDEGNETVWLVAGGSGPCVSISRDGVNVEMLPPHGSPLERREGVLRAAHRLAKLADPIGVR